MTAISIIGLCIIALLAATWTVYIGPDSTENDPTQTYPDWDWSKPQKQFKQLPYTVQVILSGPHKRRTVLYGANPRYHIPDQSALRTHMRASQKEEDDEPDKDFLDALNNI